MSDNLDVNKITAEVITDLSKTIAKQLFEKGKSFFKDLKAKDEIDFGIAFEDYLEYTSETYSKLKTLLYKQTPKFIYSFYEPVGILRNRKNVIDTSNVNNVLEIGKKVIITGTGGIGKSVMLKHFFLDTIKRTSFVPIFVELRSLNNFPKESINIEKHIYTIMRNHKFTLEKKYFDYSIETGCYVILFDGFDELKNDIAETVTQEIFKFCDKYPDNYYIVSSRPLQEFIGWNQFEEVKAMRLTKKQALSLIGKIEYDEVVKEKFSQALDEELYDKYKSFASTPLLLTIMLLTFENRYSMPDKLNDFYEQAFMALFHTHDATKGGYRREKFSKLGFEDFKLVFSHFCFKSFFNSDFEFTESKAIEYLEQTKKKGVISKDYEAEAYLEDLSKSVCMLVHEGLNYVFSHRSFQEYFAAVYTVQLNDIQQKEFIKRWLTEKHFRMNSNFLDMLYDLQPSRFIKNIIKPALEELNKNFIDNGESIEWLIQQLVDNVMIFEDENNKTIIGSHISNHYYYEMIRRACSIKNYNWPSSSTNDEFITDLLKEYDLDEELDITKILNSKYKDGIINELNWIKRMFDFAIQNILVEEENYAQKNMQDMLNEL